ncbi:MAG: PadR family transcriptional regulator [Planctomycetota bacterium]|nr:PadR family transcriptional regulator [Planctomycetota bacterium]
MKIHQLDLFKGTLSLLLLKSLTHGQRHGHEIMRWIRKISDETFLVEEGTIYPALHRLEARSYIESKWGITTNNRRAKFYRLTTKGKARLKQESEEWFFYVATFSQLLKAT